MKNNISVFIPSFRSPDEYLAFKELAEDADRLPVDLEDYEKSVQVTVAGISNDGIHPIRGNIILPDMIRWLKAKNVSNTGEHRSQYYAEYSRSIIPSLTNRSTGAGNV